VEGTAVFLSAEQGVVPNALLHNLKHNKVLHAQNLFVTVCNHEEPWVGLDSRLQIEALGHDCWQVTIHYGFKNDPDVPRALQLLRGHGCAVEPMTTSYFLSRDTVIPRLVAAWRPGARSCLPRCTATPVRRQTSCICPTMRWWSWAPRSSCDGLGAQRGNAGKINLAKLAFAPVNKTQTAMKTVATLQSLCTEPGNARIGTCSFSKT
jgi:hypothetical protein